MFIGAPHIYTPHIRLERESISPSPATSKHQPVVEGVIGFIPAGKLTCNTYTAIIRYIIRLRSTIVPPQGDDVGTVAARGTRLRSERAALRSNIGGRTRAAPRISKFILIYA